MIFATMIYIYFLSLDRKIKNIAIFTIDSYILKCDYLGQLYGFIFIGGIDPPYRFTSSTLY